MATYVSLTLPRSEAALLLTELRMLRYADLQMAECQRAKLVQRIEAVLDGGRDLRMRNGAAPRGKRMGYLDLRRKRA